MEVVCLSVQSTKEEWAETAAELYKTKISHHLPFRDIQLKSKKLEREDKSKKREIETQAILDQLDKGDYVILCDEQGKTLNSIEFSKKFVQIQESGKKRAVFIIGGAFGVSDELKSRANLKLSLSCITMNHLVARTVLLEQIYRAIMIWKGRPYHNE